MLALSSAYVSAGLVLQLSAIPVARVACQDQGPGRAKHRARPVDAETRSLSSEHLDRAEYFPRARGEACTYEAVRQQSQRQLTPVAF